MNRRLDTKKRSADAWSVAEAKARFSEVVARAKAGQPQHVSRYGKEEVVVVAARDWERLVQSTTPDDAWQEKPGGLLELFAPIIGSGIVFEGMGGDFRPAFDDEG